MRRFTTIPLSFALPALLASCSTDSRAAGENAMEVTHDTVGDTVVVRTVSGSAWGCDAHLVAELSIGEMEGDMEYLFGNVVSLGVTSDGTLYVVDGQVPELRAYDADGSYYGRVHTPDGFSTYPTPFIDGDRVWAVTRDELGVQRVVRFRVELDEVGS